MIIEWFLMILVRAMERSESVPSSSDIDAGGTDIRGNNIRNNGNTDAQQNSNSLNSLFGASTALETESLPIERDSDSLTYPFQRQGFRIDNESDFAQMFENDLLADAFEYDQRGLTAATSTDRNPRISQFDNYIRNRYSELLGPNGPPRRRGLYRQLRFNNGLKLVLTNATCL